MWAKYDKLSDIHVTLHSYTTYSPLSYLKEEEGKENCTLLGYCAASTVNFLLMFQDNLSHKKEGGWQDSHSVCFYS